MKSGSFENLAGTGPPFGPSFFAIFMIAKTIIDVRAKKRKAIVDNCNTFVFDSVKNAKGQQRTTNVANDIR